MKLKWNNIKDVLPIPYIYVLVAGTISKEHIDLLSIARHDGKQWEMLSQEDNSNAVFKGDLTWGMESQDITHWAALPEMPKG